MALDVSALNAIGDALVVAAALYAAYSVRKHKHMSVDVAMIAASFFIGATVFARGLQGVEFYAPMSFRFIIFAVFMVELTKHMVKGAEKLRVSYLLYVFMLVPVLSWDSYYDTLLIVYGASIMISYLIAAICFAVITGNKAGALQALPFIGFVGAAFPLAMIIYNPAVLFAPWNSLFLVGKIFLAVFFTGFALCSRKNIHCFCHAACEARGAKK